MEILLHSLSRPVKALHSGLFKEAYAFWKIHWQKTLTDVGDSLKNSNEFLRQDEYILLLAKNAIVGLFAMSWWDLDSETTWDHSYFQTLPKDLEAEVGFNSRGLMMTMGYLTVCPQWRRSNSGKSISDILVSAAVKTFLTSEAQYLFTFTRNDRKTNELGLRHGGRKIGKGFEYFGIPSDLLLFDRPNAKLSEIPGVASLVERLWRDKNQVRNKSWNDSTLTT